MTRDDLKIFQSLEVDHSAIGLEPAASARCFLTESRDLPLNQEVPVALLLYGVDGDGIPVCSLEDFADPSRLAGLELVQAVTVECTDQAL